MILLVGGLGQGKLAYALQSFHTDASKVAHDPEEAWTKPILNALEHWLLETEDPMPALEELLERNPGVVILCREVGCGVVPVDEGERAWRERVGRTCCALAERAERVIRLCCGIPMVLKGDGVPWN